MAWFPLDPEAVTPEWLSEVLGNEVRDCRLEQIGVGIGLLGRLYRAHLSGTDVPPSVVVKLPTLDQRARTALCENLGFYLAEARFYQEIGLDNPLKPARPYFAAVDPDTHDFVLVLEDLGRLRVCDQLVGCTPEDAGTVIDAVAAQHAFWWDSPRLTTLPWLQAYNRPSWSEALAANFSASWPAVLDGIGADLSPALRRFGDQFPNLLVWYVDELSRPPTTFLHGDLRLDQLLFGASPADPPVTALDWQITGTGRGAYDLAYFLVQSLTTNTRRSCEAELIERYSERLAEHGIDYPPKELLRDYRLTTASCFIYPVLAAGLISVANDRQDTLVRTMLDRVVVAIGDHDALALRPD